MPKSQLTNVLVVCKGNLARSPLAGAVLIKHLGADRVRDRGLYCPEGKLALKKVRDYAAGLGLDLSNHRSTTLRSDDLQWADLVLYMTEVHRSGIILLGCENSPTPVYRNLASFIGAERIADPAYAKKIETEAILSQLVRAIEKAISSLDRSKSPVDGPSIAPNAAKGDFRG